MIKTYGITGSLDAQMGPHAPKPTAVTEGQTEASLSIWEGGKISTGLWECTPGTFTATRDGYTEICTILTGTVTIEVEGEENVTYGPNDVIVMPSGWAGLWHIHETVGKHFTIIND